MLKRTFWALFSLLICELAFAQAATSAKFALLPTFTQFSVEKSEGTETSNGEAYDTDSLSSSSIQYIGIGAGYLTGMGIYFGVHFMQTDLETTEKSTDRTGTDLSIDEQVSTEQIKATGLSVGYLSANLKLIVNYYLQVENSYTIDYYQAVGDASGSAQVKGEADGEEAYTVDLAYGFNAGGLSVGPQITYMKYVYTGLESAISSPTISGTSSLSGGFEETRIIPTMALWYSF